MKVFLRLKNSKEDSTADGRWFDLPVRYEDLHEAFGMGVRASDLEITEWDLPSAYGMYDGVALEEINELYRAYASIENADILRHVDALLKSGMFRSLQELVDVQEDIRFYRGDSMSGVIRRLIKQGHFGDICPMIQCFIDYEGLGEMLEQDYSFIFVSDGAFEVFC